LAAVITVEVSLPWQTSPYMVFAQWHLPVLLSCHKKMGGRYRMPFIAIAP